MFNTPTHDLLQVFEMQLEYNPRTGAVTRKYHPTVPTTKRGKSVDTPHPDGYLSFYQFNRTWPVHRVAWFLYYKQWPEHRISHVNGDKTDNRITNLCRDTRRPEVPLGHSGIRGVYKHNDGRKNKPWFALLTLRNSDGRAAGRKRLGHYDTKEEAIQALKTAEAAQATPQPVDPPPPGW